MKGLDDIVSKPQPDNPEETTKEEAGRIEATPSVDSKDLDMLALGRALGMEKLDVIKKNSLRIEHLMNWARGKGAKDQLGLVAEVKHLIHRLGSPSIHDLYVYTRLDNQRTEAVEKMNKMEKPV